MGKSKKNRSETLEIYVKKKKKFRELDKSIVVEVIYFLLV